MLLFQMPYQLSHLLSLLSRHSSPSPSLHIRFVHQSCCYFPLCSFSFPAWCIDFTLPPPSGSHFTQATFLGDFLATSSPLPRGTYVLLGSPSHHFWEGQAQAPLFGLVLDDPVSSSLCPMQAGCSPQTGLDLSPEFLLTLGALTHCCLSLRPVQIPPQAPSRNLSHYPRLGGLLFLSVLLHGYSVGTEVGFCHS